MLFFDVGGSISIAPSLRRRLRQSELITRISARAAPRPLQSAGVEHGVELLDRRLGDGPERRLVDLGHGRREDAVEPASGPRRPGRSSRPRRSPLRARFATRRFLSTDRETRASELVARAPVRRMASGAADRSATDHGASLAIGSKSKFRSAAGRSSSSSTPWRLQSFAFNLSSIFMMPCSRFMSYLAVIMLRFWPPDMFDVSCRRGRAFDEVSRCGATTRTASTTGSPTGAGQRRYTRHSPRWARARRLQG